MDEKKYAKALLLNDEIYDVALLPIADVVLKNVKELEPFFNSYDPFSEVHKKYDITLEVRIVGTLEELKGIQHAKKVSLIPRDEK